MQRITFNLAASATLYVPVPVRGVVAGAHTSFQATVTTSNIITLSRETTSVAVITAATTTFMVRENAVRDTTNKDLVFDPDTAAYSYIKVVASGGNAVAAVVTIDFDDSARVEQTPLEA
jgi:hypothetical protein